LQGLVGPFLEAGARAVIATYWDVRDDALAGLMHALYARLRTGIAAGTALRLAKLAALRAGAPPSSWAGLAIYGDADVRPLAGLTAAR